MKTEPSDKVYFVDSQGLTKRELFAAMAMQGLSSINMSGWNWTADDIALEATKRADALINQLNKPTEE